MVIHLIEPCAAEVVVRPGALGDNASELGRVRVGGADCVVAACGEAPGADLGGVEVRLGLDPVEDGGPEAIGGGRVVALGRACLLYTSPSPRD